MEIVLIVVMFTVNAKVVKVPQFAYPVTLLTLFHLPIVLFVLWDVSHVMLLNVLVARLISIMTMELV